MNSFHPDSIKDNLVVPPVVITSLTRINKDRMEEGPIPVKGISAFTDQKPVRQSTAGWRDSW